MLCPKASDCFVPVGSLAYAFFGPEPSFLDPWDKPPAALSDRPLDAAALAALAALAGASAASSSSSPKPAAKAMPKMSKRASAAVAAPSGGGPALTRASTAGMDLGGVSAAEVLPHVPVVPLVPTRVPGRWRPIVRELEANGVEPAWGSPENPRTDGGSRFRSFSPAAGVELAVLGPWVQAAAVEPVEVLAAAFNHRPPAYSDIRVPNNPPQSTATAPRPSAAPASAIASSSSGPFPVLSNLQLQIEAELAASVGAPIPTSALPYASTLSQARPPFAPPKAIPAAVNRAHPPLLRCVSSTDCLLQCVFNLVLELMHCHQ